MLDRIDKAIIRLLLNNQGKFLSTNEIALKVKISPLTAKRHLKKLENDGYTESREVGKAREYEITK